MRIEVELAQALGCGVDDPRVVAIAATLDPRGSRNRRIYDIAQRDTNLWVHDKRTGEMLAEIPEIAAVADVTVDRNGNVKVTRAVSVVDAGLAVNPDGIINQIEGGIIQSASWTLKEQVKFDRQRITTRSWADYQIGRAHV